MYLIRPSVPADIPALRQLWKLAFGDGDAYVDNFFHTYYQPGRVLVLEENGAVMSMTAWFDTQFAVPGQGTYRAAYLYAVATHPHARGRGLSGQLQAWADNYFRALGIPAVTTVPAQPSLHNFFAAHGFRECFVHTQRESHPLRAPEGTPPFSLEPLSPEDYAALREELLSPLPHIVLDREALACQAGACALTPGGGLYAAHTPWGRTLVCAEGMEDSSLLVKELLSDQPGAESALLEWLPRLLPAWRGTYRVPRGNIPFGMLKWLDPRLEQNWDWTSTAYLGLAFD